MTGAPRSTLPGLVLSCLLLAATAARGEPDQAQPEAVRVFFPGARCASGVLEVEAFDRASKSWIPHPRHPRILGDSCQTEDPGRLLNEIRVRCAEPPRRGMWNAWDIGVDVWSPELLERCPQRVPRRRDALVVDFEIDQPRPGAVLESGDLRTRVEGRVHVDGRPPGKWDVVLLLDASPGPEGRALPADGVTALLDWARALGRDGELRTAVVSWASGPPADPRVARPAVDVTLEDDATLLETTVRDFAAVPVAGAPGLTEALAGALAELERRGRADASLAVVVIVDGRASLPLGEGAGREPRLRRQLETAARPARERSIPVHVLALGGAGETAPEVLDSMLDGTPSHWRRLPRSGGLADALASLPLARLDAVEIRNPAARRPPLRADIGDGGRFAADVRLRDGENALRLRAIGTNGRATDVRLRLTLDNAELREVLLEREREHMRRIRALDKRVIIEAEEP